MKKIIVQYSGGKDSTACLVKLSKEGYDVEALHFKHDFAYALPTEEATRICNQLNIPLTIINITAEIENRFLNYKGRPCRLCKAIMDSISVDYAVSKGIHQIAVGDTGSDTTLVNRIKLIEENGGQPSKYFNVSVSLPDDMHIIRPLINYSNDDVFLYLKKNGIEVKRNNDTGDRYFEYSREGCPLQFKDFGIAYTKSLMQKLHDYNILCTQFATNKGIRAAIHLPSEFIVTIPKGYETACRNFLIQNGAVLKPKEMRLFTNKMISFDIQIYQELLDTEVLIDSMSRFLERLNDEVVDVSETSSDIYLISMVGKHISIAVHIDKMNLLLYCSMFDQRGVRRNFIENLFVEVFHTYDYHIYS